MSRAGVPGSRGRRGVGDIIPAKRFSRDGATCGQRVVGEEKRRRKGKLRNRREAQIDLVSAKEWNTECPRCLKVMRREGAAALSTEGREGGTTKSETGDWDNKGELPGLSFLLGGAARGGAESLSGRGGCHLKRG